MSDIKVVHHRKEHYDVYIGRPSKWENPYIIGLDGTRKEVIDKYHKWLLTQKDLLNDLHELDGKRLGCWCAPLPCHGDILKLERENQLFANDEDLLRKLNIDL